MDHQALDIRDVCQQREDLQMIDESPGRFLAPLDLEGKNRRAPVGEILFIQFVVGMVRQGRMVHLFHKGMCLQVFHDLLCVFGMSLKAERKGLHALQKQEGIEGRDRGSCIAQENGADVSDKGCGADRIIEGDSVIAGVGLGNLGIFAAGFPVELSGLNDNTAQGRSVSPDEFGRRMYHDISPVFNRSDQIGSSESIVNDKRKSVAVGDLRDRVYIRDVAVRVSQRLQIDSPGIFLNSVLNLFQIVGIHKCRRDPELRQSVGEQVEAAAVDSLLGYDMSPVGRQGLNGICNRRGSRCKGQACASSFEGGHSLFQHILCGIGQSSINIAGIRKAETVSSMLTVVKHIGSCLINRHSAGIRGRIRLFLSDMKLKCFKFIFTHFYSPFYTVL